VLVGLHRNHVAIGVLGLQSPLVLLSVVLITQAGLPFGPYIAVLPYLALLLLQIVLLGLAGRSINPSLARAIRDVPRLRSVRGGAVFDVAWPMLIWMVGTVIAMQTDRLILSHTSTQAALAEYNLSAQIFLPVLHVVGAGGFALWPIFAKQRADQARVSPLPISLVFGAIAALGCLVLAFATPLVTRLASGGRVDIHPLTALGFSVLVVFQCLKYPLNVYLTDPPGLRFQVYVLLATLPLNLVLSYTLAGRIGAAGPVTGSAVAIALQYFACLAYTARVHRRPVAVPEEAQIEA
jgi:Na+-driven multidrug efflux pump